MKKFIAIIAIVLMAITANSQNINLSNIGAKGSFFSSFNYSTKTFDWTIDNLSINESDNNYFISFDVFYVTESDYIEIPNDTTRYTFTGEFTKLTKKDGSGITYRCSVNEVTWYNVIISEQELICEKYPERSYHTIDITIIYQVVTKGYSVYFSIDYNDWQNLIN